MLSWTARSDSVSRALVARRQHPCLPDPGVVPERELVDEVVGVGQPGRPLHPLHFHLVRPEGDGAGDAVVEQLGLLQDEPDLAPEPAWSTWPAHSRTPGEGTT